MFLIYLTSFLVGFVLGIICKNKLVAFYYFIKSLVNKIKLLFKGE